MKKCSLKKYSLDKHSLKKCSERICLSLLKEEAFRTKFDYFLLLIMILQHSENIGKRKHLHFFPREIYLHFWFLVFNIFSIFFGFQYLKTGFLANPLSSYSPTWFTLEHLSCSRKPIPRFSKDLENKIRIKPGKVFPPGFDLLHFVTLCGFLSLYIVHQ